MNRMEHTNTGKRRLPKAGVIALAAGCVLSIAAGLPAQVYNFVAGGQVIIEPRGNNASFTTVGEDGGPVTVENGRLMFEADGQRLDITDKVDENTPYIYERTDPVTGNKGYVVVGGTVDNYGWVEYFLDLDKTPSCAVVSENEVAYVSIDGQQIPVDELTDAHRDILRENDRTRFEFVYRPWMNKAIEQLELKVALELAD